MGDSPKGTNKMSLSKYLLVACEESQRVTTAFRTKGIEAYSCDILPTSGDHPEWHIKGDVLSIINGGRFMTMDGKFHFVDKWYGIIAFPPCTYFTNAGGQCWSEKLFSREYIEDRKRKRFEMFGLVLKIWGANSERVAIENPVGWLSTHWQKPSQIIEPYYFGDNAKKRTCLWLRGLPLLKPTDLLAKPMPTYTQTGGVRDGTNRYFAECVQGSINRSKTFPGVAEAMADQWGF